jgi:hypothetical protein
MVLVKFAGRAVKMDVSSTVGWLAKAGLTPSSRHKKALRVFLLHWDRCYDERDQTGLWRDFERMFAPVAELSVQENPAMYATWERIHTGMMWGKVYRMRMDPTKIPVVVCSSAFSFPTSDTRAFWVAQNHIGISQTGKTWLYTTGFSGCLGVIVRPVNAAGGILAHIFEPLTAGSWGSDPRTYITDNTTWLLDEAKKRGWNEVDMVLFIGGVTENDVSEPRLRDWIRLKTPSGMKVRHVQDLRHFFRSMDSFMYDPGHHRLYILAKGFEQASEDAFCEWNSPGTDVSLKPSAEDTLALESAGGHNMKWHVFD